MDSLIRHCYECGFESTQRSRFKVVGEDLYHCRAGDACDKRSAKIRREYANATQPRRTRRPLVERRGSCLIWLGPKNSNDYAYVDVNRRRVLLHRLVHEIVHGPIEDRNVVRHTCDTPSCIEPSHLLQGTQLDNMRDMWDRGRAFPQVRAQLIDRLSTESEPPHEGYPQSLESATVTDSFNEERT